MLSLNERFQNLKKTEIVLSTQSRHAILDYTFTRNLDSNFLPLQTLQYFFPQNDAGRFSKSGTKIRAFDSNLENLVVEMNNIAPGLALSTTWICGWPQRFHEKFLLALGRVEPLENLRKIRCYLLKDTGRELPLHFLEPSMNWHDETLNEDLLNELGLYEYTPHHHALEVRILPSLLNFVRQGTKTLELHLNEGHYKQLMPGQAIKLIQMFNPEDVHFAVVKDRKDYRNLEELFDYEELCEIYPGRTHDKAVEACLDFFNYESFIHGLVVFRI